MSSRDDIRQWLLAELATCLASVFEAMTGEKAAIGWKPGSRSADQALWRQPLAGIPDGRLLVAASQTDARAIGGQVLKAAGLDDADDATLQSTFLEVLGQAFSGLATALSSRLGREIACGTLESVPSDAASAEWFHAQLGFGGAGAGIELGIVSAVLDALVEPPTVVAPPQPAPSTSRTLDLLLDVELPISVSFGRAQLALKDVIKLTTGSIVELNRSISEPVEVIVNNCVIARGEVVVVEGNFGVRIQEVISRQERLRTLN